MLHSEHGEADTVDFLGNILPTLLIRKPSVRARYSGLTTDCPE